MTRSELNPNLDAFDPEIERTLRLIITVRRGCLTLVCVEDSSANNYAYNSPISISSHKVDLSSNSAFDFVVSTPNSSNFVLPENMANTYDRTLRELAAPKMNYQALAIQYPDLDADFELKSGAKVPWSGWRGPSQAFEGIPCGMFNHEAIWCG